MAFVKVQSVMRQNITGSTEWESEKHSSCYRTSVCRLGAKVKDATMLILYARDIELLTLGLGRTRPEDERSQDSPWLLRSARPGRRYHFAPAPAFLLPTGATVERSLSRVCK